ncbi:hypothetical protein JY412_13425, partial [Stenotrophomonas maltophilia]|nr:hypothetical protein [Stenotrophomonas maltophilia]
ARSNPGWGRPGAANPMALHCPVDPRHAWVLREEAWRQPRLAATNRLPASGRHYRQIHTNRG